MYFIFFKSSFDTPLDCRLHLMFIADWLCSLLTKNQTLKLEILIRGTNIAVVGHALHESK